MQPSTREVKESRNSLRNHGRKRLTIPLPARASRVGWHLLHRVHANCRDVFRVGTKNVPTLLGCCRMFIFDDKNEGISIVQVGRVLA